MDAITAARQVKTSGDPVSFSHAMPNQLRDPGAETNHPCTDTTRYKDREHPLEGFVVIDSKDGIALFLATVLFERIFALKKQLRLSQRDLSSLHLMEQVCNKHCQAFALQSSDVFHQISPKD